MASYYNPRIITNGLLFFVDAANRKSYIPILSGSTWRDISGYNNNGTLTPTFSAPSHSTAQGGYFTFNGTTHYVNIENPTLLQITQGSIGVWFNTRSNANSGYNGLISKQGAWGLFVKDDAVATYDWGNGTGTGRETLYNTNKAAWIHAIMTFTETVGSPSNNAKIYVNGNLELTTTVKHSVHTNPVQIAEANASQFYTGDISMGYIYNTVLTAEQVKENYNAHRTRYGL